MTETLILFLVLIASVVLVFILFNYLISRKQDKEYEKEFISQIRSQEARYDRLNSIMINLVTDLIITSIRNKNK
jgi:flagellar basal body-associated protein FliL